jgi:uncharacterized membrane protein
MMMMMMILQILVLCFFISNNANFINEFWGYCGLLYNSILLKSNYLEFFYK